MEHDEHEKLSDCLGGLAGGGCTLPFERMRDLTGGVLPEAAASSAWWADPDEWQAWPGTRAWASAGWRVESEHAGARLVGLEGIGDELLGDYERIRRRRLRRSSGIRHGEDQDSER